jgi:hypothetical protein
MLASARPFLLRLYAHAELPTSGNKPNCSNPVSTLSGRDAARLNNQTAISSRSTGFDAKVQTRISRKWKDLLWFPAPSPKSEIPHAVKTLLFRAVYCAWIGLASCVGSDKEVSGATSQWIQADCCSTTLPLCYSMSIRGTVVSLTPIPFPNAWLQRLSTRYSYSFTVN